MNLDYIENLIDRENINLIKTKALENTDGAFARYENTNVILYNADSKTKAKCILAEELNHYYYDATYNYNADKTSVDKAEFKAKKHTYQLLVPLDKLKEAVSNGINNIEELAEYFEVTYEFMQNCLYHYKNLCLI